MPINKKNPSDTNASYATDSNSSTSTRSTSVVREDTIEYGFIETLKTLKYEYRDDITNRKKLEDNFRAKFQTLNRVTLTDAEFARLLDEIVTPDVFTAAKTLRSINSFTRDDGTPLNYTLVNIKDWCKNTYEVVNQLRINTTNSHHRYDVILLINGVPCVQIELKTLGVNPRRAMEQIVDYKNDPGNGYSKTILCFMQLFIVSNRDRTYYFANNPTRHFDNAPLEKGCIRVVDGSHKNGPIPHVADGGWHLPFDQYPLESSVACPAKAGDVLFFSYLTVHGSGVNTSTEARTTLLVQMRDPEDQPTIVTHLSRGQGMMLRGVDPTASAGSNVEWSLSTPKPQSAMGGMGMGMGMGDPMGGTKN